MMIYEYILHSNPDYVNLFIYSTILTHIITYTAKLLQISIEIKMVCSLFTSARQGNKMLDFFSPCHYNNMVL